MHSRQAAPAPADGRSTRWAGHREARRAELVEATLRALRRHGAGVGMTEVAAAAGTSKAVLYRHFADKDELYLAVCRRLAERLVGELRAAMSPATAPRDMVAAAVDGYLQLIEADPEVYRFVVRQPLDRPGGTDPVAGLVSLVGAEVTAVVAERLAAAGRDPAPASAWGHGIVGLVRAAADDWIEREPRMPRADLARCLTDLVWGGLAHALGEPAGGPGRARRPAPRPSRSRTEHR